MIGWLFIRYLTLYTARTSTTGQEHSDCDSYKQADAKLGDGFKANLDESGYQLKTLQRVKLDMVESQLESSWDWKTW